MYRVNLLLRFIIVVLTIITVVITNNRIILWLLLFGLSFYHLQKNKIKLLLIDLILIILLGYSVDNEISLYIFKIFYIVNYLITIYNNLSSEDKKIIFSKKNTSKMMYYENNFDRIVDRIKEKKIEIYEHDVSIDNKIKNDLERNYLQAKIRYLDAKNNSIIKWNEIDTLILLFTIVLFLIFFILR